MVPPHAVSEDEWENEEGSIVIAWTEDPEDRERRKGELEEARRLNRLPQLPARPDTACLALLTNVAYGICDGGEVERVEWIGV
jgi:hypothetical protein